MRKKLLSKNNLLRFFVLALFALGASVTSWGQCDNNGSYGSAAAPTAPGTTTINTNMYAGSEYNTITGVAANTTYISSHSYGTGSYITVLSGNSTVAGGGTVIAFGQSPLLWTSVGSGTYYVHYNTSATCGRTTSGSYTSYLAYVGPSGKNLTLTPQNNANNRMDVGVNTSGYVGLHRATAENGTYSPVNGFYQAGPSATAPSTSLSIPANTNFMVEFWVMQNAQNSTANREGWEFNIIPSGMNSINIDRYWASASQLRFHSGGTQQYGANNAHTNGIYEHIKIIRIGAIYYLYKNSTYITSVTYANTNTVACTFAFQNSQGSVTTTWQDAKILPLYSSTVQDVGATDVAIPNTPTGLSVTNTASPYELSVGCTATDNGTTYYYYGDGFHASMTASDVLYRRNTGEEIPFFHNAYSDFQNSAQTPWLTWTSAGTVTYTWNNTYASNNRYNDAYAMGMSSTTANVGVLYFDQIGSIVNGQKYLVSFWTKRASAGTATISGYTHNVDDGSVATGGGAAINPTSEWQYYSFVATGTTNGKMRVHIVYDNSGGGTGGQILVDKVQLHPIYSATVTTGIKDYYVTGTNANSWSTSNPRTITGLSPNTQYCYTVKARDNANNESATTSSVCRYTRATIPTLTATANCNGEISLSWSGGAYSTYRIVCTETGTVVAAGATASPPFVHTGLASGLYNYTLYVRNGDGLEEAVGATASATIIAPLATPLVIETVPATACSGQVTLSQTQSNLVAHYPFNGTLNDISGNNLNLTATSGTATYSDGGLYLNGGGSQSFASPSNSFLSNNTYYTIEFDYLPKVNNGATWAKIFTWDPTGDRAPGIFTHNPNIGFHWRHNSDLQPAANAGVDDGAFTLNQWYHIVGVRKGTQFYLYVDGVLRQTATLPSDTRAGSAPFIFGAAGGNTAPAGTVIKEFKIWNKSFDWYSGSCNGTLVGRTPTVDVNPASTTTYYLSQTNNCGTSSCTPIIVSRNPIPAVPTVSASNPNFCAPNTTNLVAQGMAPSGQAINFTTGSFSYVTVPHGVSNNLTGTCTIEGWINPSSYTGQQIIFNKENQYEAALEPGTGRFQWAYNINPMPSWAWITTNTVIPLNTWTHFALVYNQVGGTMTTYINGNLVHVEKASTAGITTQTTDLRIGNRSSNSPFYGGIDNVRLWNVARTQTQILADMNFETPTNATGLLANYPLNGNGTALTGANGTLVNAGGATWVNPNYYTYTWSNGPQLPSASTNQTQTTGSLTDANAGAHNYRVTASTATCPGTLSANVPVTVAAKPVLPTLSIDHNVTAENCHGRTVTLTATGGSIPGASRYIYGTASGGTQVSTATTNTTVTHTPTATTTYYVGVTANGACPAQNIVTPITYTLPSKGTALSGNESAMCYVSGNNPIHFYAPSQNYIGSINPRGRTGVLTMTSYVGTVGTMYACNMPTNENYRTAYMGRHFTVVPTGAISGVATDDLDVYFPYTETEYNNLVSASTTTTAGNPNDNVTSHASIAVTKYSETGNEDGDPHNNCFGAGSSVVVQQNGNNGLGSLGLSPAILGTNFYARFPVSSFSEFHLHGSSNNSPLPITLTSFAGNCNENGVQLSWTTATETNVNHFEIYRSRNGQSWDLVANVDAVGNSSTANHYQATDAKGIETMYYKLRSVDNDGTFEDFNPISVRCDIKGQAWSLHPVPATTQATITIETDRAISDNIVIMDMNGRAVQTQAINLEVGVNYILLDVQHFAKGTYMVKMNNETEYKPLKLMKID